MTDRRPVSRRRTLPVAIVLVLAVLGAVAGVISAAVHGTDYTSESQLAWDPSVRAQIDPNYASPDPSTFDRQVADQHDVILSDAVVDTVSTQLKLSDDAVRKQVAITTTSGSSVIVIDATARTASAARTLAQSITNAYVGTLRSRNDATLNRRIDALTPVIDQLRKQLTAAGTSAAAGPLASNIADLQSQQAAYTVAASSVPVEARVLRSAETPASPSSLSPFVSAVLGAALGLVLAVCIVLLLNSVLIARRAARAAGSIPMIRDRRPDATTRQVADGDVVDDMGTPRTVPDEPGEATGGATGGATPSFGK